MKKIPSLSIFGRGFGLSLFIVILSMLSNACDSSDADGNDTADGDLEQEAADGDNDVADGDHGESDLEPINEAEEAEFEEADADYEMETEWGPIDPQLAADDLVLPPNDVEEVELPRGIKVRVASYNVYGFNYADAATIGAMLADLNPDLVSLQEMRAEQLQTLAEAAGMAHYYTLEDKAILSKTPLENTGSIGLLNGRSLLHANTIIDGVPFSFYAAHISWNVDGDIQCRQIIDDVISSDTFNHLIIAGDFNDEVYSSQINILSEKLSDVFSAVGLYPGQRISWPSTRFDDSEGSQMIDLVFFRRDFPAIVTYADIINLAPVLSDHKPVIAELLFPSNAAVPFDEDPFAAVRDVWRGFPHEGERPQNLLVNPSAEDGLNGWLAADGAVTVSERENQSARSGAGMFTGFAKYESGTPHLSSAYQEVDISAMSADVDARRIRVFAAGYMSTGYQTVSNGEIVANKPLPYDEGEIVVELLDADGVSLQQHYSGRRDTLDWHPFAAVLNAAPGVRKLRFSWISHHKPNNGASNDALFDDLYLGVTVLPDTHNRCGANLLANPGAELAELLSSKDGVQHSAPAWELDGWQVVPDRHVLAFVAPYPSLTFSGKYYFLGGDVDLISNGKAGLSTLAQKIDLTSWRSAIAAGNFALRWGGSLRTWAAANGVTPSLEIYDSDGSLWGRVSGAEIRAAEWTHVEYLTRIPPGASAVRLLLEADVEERGMGVMADALFVMPELTE